jgi:hypothetical protein
VAAAGAWACGPEADTAAEISRGGRTRSRVPVGRGEGRSDQQGPRARVREGERAREERG